MSKIQIGGVPEHFNMPWHYLKELGNEHVNFQWQDFQGGTGDLVKALDQGDLDLATLLTEGAIKGIDSGAKFRILNFFVDSPLIWGIHVPARSEYHDVEHVKGKKYAISRYGSGSHLISYLDAKNRAWPVENLDFIEVGGMQGARKAFETEEADVFLWEKFTTKPLVDQGEFRILGECVPGFSSFVICVSEESWRHKNAEVRRLLAAVLASRNALISHPDNALIIADHYQMDVSDVQEWLKRTRWTLKPDLDRHKIDAALSVLKELSLIKSTLEYQDLVIS